MAINTEMPGWLGARSQGLLESNMGSAGELGHNLGLATGAVSRMINETEQVEEKDAQGNPIIDPATGKPKTTQKHIGFSQALGEARASFADPLWAVKLEKDKADTQAAWLGVQMQGKEFQAQQDDAKPFADWANELKSNANASMPQFNSLKYQALAQNAYKMAQTASLAKAKEQQAMQKQNQFVAWDNAVASMEADPKGVEFAKKISELPPRADGRSVSPDGYILDENNEKMGIDPRIKSILNEYHLSVEKPPFGLDGTAAKAWLEDRKAKNQSALQAQKDTATLARDEAQLKASIEKIDKTYGYKIEIEKMRDAAAVDKNGRRISDVEFINRHLNSVAKGITDSWDKRKDGPYDHKKVLNKAMDILSEAYKSIPHQEQSSPAAEPSTSPTPATTAKPSSTSAKPSAPLSWDGFLKYNSDQFKK